MKKEQFIFGIHPVLQALEVEKTIDKLFVQKGMDHSKIEAIISMSEKMGVSVNEVPIEKLDRMVRSNHQGVIAIASPIAFRLRPSH